ncbi:MAG: class I SAM-dependent methyltransferase [Firmicutes bacterium]|nr:class I SAM-dependent methyltransferase [Bacillota bacterium]
MIYNTLAGYYDCLVKDDEATQDWVKWIGKYVSPCKTLELACGSGEITEQLSEKGYQVTALDLSAQMVEQAKAKDVEGKIEFFVQDMKDLSNFSSFDTILCLCDSFNYILSKEEISAFIKEVSEHLNENGYFLFDTHSLDRMSEFEEEWNETGIFEDGCGYQWSISSEQDWLYQDFAFYLPNGEMIQEHHLQKIYDPAWLEEELRQYFEIVSVDTDFILPGIQEGEKYFYVLRKR